MAQEICFSNSKVEEFEALSSVCVIWVFQLEWKGEFEFERDNEIELSNIQFKTTINQITTMIFSVN